MPINWTDWINKKNKFLFRTLKPDVNGETMLLNPIAINSAIKNMSKIIFSIPKIAKKYSGKTSINQL